MLRSETLVRVAGASLLLASTADLRAQDGSTVFPVAQPVQFETGDTWSQRNGRFRLYGVQSCLRGTTYTDPAGVRRDCGQASIAQLAAVFKVASPTCQKVAPANDGAFFVVCGGTIDSRPIEVGNAMIASGYAFAAATPDGKPLNMQYLISEVTAKNSRSGLWAAPDLPHPVYMLLRQLRQQSPRGQ